MLTTKLKELFYWIVSSLIIVAPALYNRYPLMYFDSGAYMEMSINLEPSFHRSIGYPLMMKLTGWGISNWPIIFLQGLLISWLHFRVFSLFDFRNTRLTHFLGVMTLSFGSALSWYAAQLMPDIFTLIVLLSFLLLWLDKTAPFVRKIVLAVLMVFGMMAHLSHIPLVLLLVISLIAAEKLQWISKEYSLLKRLNWLWIVTPMVLAFISISTHNAMHQHGFRMSMASNVFITANLGEMGILKLYLDENCGEKEIPLCNIKENLPKETGGFLWAGDAFVNHHPEGWVGANEECSVIVHDFLTKPRYLKWLVIASVKATLKQMFQIELGSGLHYAYKEGTPPYWPMKTHFKQELNEYLISVQNKGDELPLRFFKVVNYITLFASLALLGWVLLQGKLSPMLGAIILFVGLAYFYHAAITGVLANVYDRLQVRVLPMIQMLGFLIAAIELRKKRKSED